MGSMNSTVKKFFVASLIYFVLGLLAQTLAVLDVWLGLNPFAYTAVTATEQIFLVGWLTQLALALIYDRWLPGASYGTVVFVLLNLGLPLVIVGQPGVAVWGGVWIGVLAGLGALLQLFAGIIFVWEAWRFSGTGHP